VEGPATHLRSGSATTARCGALLPTSDGQLSPPGHHHVPTASSKPNLLEHLPQPHSSTETMQPRLSASPRDSMVRVVMISSFLCALTHPHPLSFAPSLMLFPAAHLLPTESRPLEALPEPVAATLRPSAPFERTLRSLLPSSSVMSSIPARAAPKDQDDMNSAETAASASTSVISNEGGEREEAHLSCSAGFCALPLLIHWAKRF